MIAIWLVGYLNLAEFCLRGVLLFQDIRAAQIDLNTDVIESFQIQYLYQFLTKMIKL